MRLSELLHAIHADVANAARRILRDHHRQRDVRPAVFGPAREDRQLVEIDLVAAPHDFLTRWRADLHARRKLRHLQQSRQQRQLADKSFGHLEIEQLRDARADRVQVVDAERQRHAPHRTEQVDRHRILAIVVPSRRTDVLEQQRLAATRLLRHAIGDLA